MREGYFLNLSFDIDTLLLHVTNSLIMEFSVDQIKLDFSLVVEIPEPAHHGGDFLNLFIEITMMSGSFINGLIEAEFPVSIFFYVFSERELMTDRNGEIPMIFDDGGEIDGESVVGIDLLSYESSLLEVTVEDLPHVVFGALGLIVLAHYCTSKIYIFRFTQFLNIVG